MINKIILATLVFCSIQTFAKPTSRLRGVVSFVDEKGNSTKAKSVVYITGYVEKSNGKTYKIIQKDKTFHPDVLPIIKGDKIDFENADQISHNVFSVSSARQFDLGQTNYSETKTVDFSNIGIVEIFCNIHPEMYSTVLVLPNPSYSIVDENGRYDIKNIPTGKYKAYVWTRSGKAQVLEINAIENKILEQNWTVTVKTVQAGHLNKFGKPYGTGKNKY